MLVNRQRNTLLLDNRIFTYATRAAFGCASRPPFLSYDGYREIFGSRRRAVCSRSGRWEGWGGMDPRKRRVFISGTFLVFLVFFSSDGIHATNAPHIHVWHDNVKLASEWIVVPRASDRFPRYVFHVADGSSFFRFKRHGPVSDRTTGGYCYCYRCLNIPYGSDLGMFGGTPQIAVERRYAYNR